VTVSLRWQKAKANPQNKNTFHNSLLGHTVKVQMFSSALNILEEEEIQKRKNK
jgi:hypothetical protein